MHCHSSHQLLCSTEWPVADTVGYIAQHELVDQLPVLRKYFKPPNLVHFSTPLECYDSACPRQVNVSKLAKVNCWLGTAGTVTPLHFDSYDNLLVQVRPALNHVCEGMRGSLSGSST